MTFDNILSDAMTYLHFSGRSAETIGAFAVPLAIGLVIFVIGMVLIVAIASNLRVMFFMSLPLLLCVAVIIQGSPAPHSDQSPEQRTQSSADQNRMYTELVLKCHTQTCILDTSILQERKNILAPAEWASPVIQSYNKKMQADKGDAIVQSTFTFIDGDKSSFSPMMQNIPTRLLSISKQDGQYYVYVRVFKTLQDSIDNKKYGIYRIDLRPYLAMLQPPVDTESTTQATTAAANALKAGFENSIGR